MADDNWEHTHWHRWVDGERRVTHSHPRPPDEQHANAHRAHAHSNGRHSHPHGHDIYPEPDLSR